MSYREHDFRCYVCGASGTVIDFVMQLYGLDFQSACKKIDTDFRLGLNVGRKLDAEKQAEAERVCAERRAEKRRHDAERKRLYDAYHKALDEWIALDKAIQDEAPQTPWDDVSMHYAECLKRITVVGAALDEAEINLWEFEKGNNERISSL